VRFSLALQTFIAMILGFFVGIFWGKNLLFLGELSKTLIWIIKALSLPLIFFAILEGFLKSEFKGKGFSALILVSAINACCAITIALFIANTFSPGSYLALPKADLSESGWLRALGEQFSFSKIGNLITGTSLVILVSLVLGLVFRKESAAKNKLTQLSSWALSWLFRILEKIVLIIPLAVFGSVVKAIGTSGLSVASGLLAYFLACFFGMFLQIIIVYQVWISFFGKMSLKNFWKNAWEPAFHAFGVNSSLATLPLSLTAMEKLKVSAGSSRLSACIGTNFNNDGILLYEVVAALFLLQAYGIQLSISQQVFLAFISVIACLGVAGIPEAGIISLTIVLSSIGLPLEAIPILLSVDWFLARMRSFTNVLADITVGIAIDRLTGQGKFSRK